MSKSKKVWIVTGKSGPKRFDKEPASKELRRFIAGTGEELDCGGPGDFGSWVYLTVEEV